MRSNEAMNHSMNLISIVLSFSHSKANLPKIQHCQNHRQRLQKDKEKRGKFSDTRSVAKFDTPVAFKGKLPANKRRTKDILVY